MKDRATQLLIKYKSGALVTQLVLLLCLQKKVKSHLDICCPWSPEELVPFEGRRSQGIFYASVEKHIIAIARV